MVSTARVQRGPSKAARCASTEDRQAPSPPNLLVPLLPFKNRVVDPRMRASNEASLILYFPQRE